MTRIARTTAFALLSAGLLALGQVATVVAALDAGPLEATTSVAAASGPVLIDAGASATRRADVTVTVAPPTTSASLLRVSNDDGTTWVQIAYATTFAWLLVDPAAGGVDADGTKSVTVETDDGLGQWVALGTASILLDRTAPDSWGIQAAPSGWWVNPSMTAWDAGVGLARTEISLDGQRWRSLEPAPPFGEGINDFRDAMSGGSWQTGLRTVYGRAVDRLGNVSRVWTTEVDVVGARRADDVPATFEFPLPAVTGQPFTIKPIFDAGFKVRAGDFCEWRITAGDPAARLQAAYNETLIDVTVPVSAKNGVCPPWTFTLPYTPAREYTWRLGIMRTEDQEDYWIGGEITSFRAELGSTSRAISYSSLPLFYLLPDRELVGADGIVTYRLKTAGGMSLASGMWYCESPNHPNPPQGFTPQSQSGGYSFACRVTSSGPWAAVWARFSGGRRWLVQYDPIGDRHKPVVTSLHVLPAPKARGGSGVTVLWTGRDSGTGVARYQLAASRNGGAYVTIPLPSAKSTSIDRSVVSGSSYRFRVRAIDRAGNVGAWYYSATIKLKVYDDSASIVHWTGPWTTAPLAGAVKGSARTASTSGSSVVVHVIAKGVAVVAPRGPNAGFAQVWRDGVLVATIDLFAPSAQPPATVFRSWWTKAGSHLIRIVPLGTVGRPDVTIDAFVVLP